MKFLPSAIFKLLHESVVFILFYMWHELQEVLYSQAKQCEQLLVKFSLFMGEQNVLLSMVLLYGCTTEWKEYVLGLSIRIQKWFN